MRCAECGSVLSPSPRKRKAKIDFYYRCKQRYGHGARDCTHTRHHKADVLEETVWTVVYGLLSDPQRLIRQIKVYLERERRQMRGDPDRKVRDLAERLEKLEQRRSGYLDLAADGDISRDDLRTKLTEVAERRDQLQAALREAQGHQDALRRSQQSLADLRFVLLHMDPMRLKQASPEDRRRVYEALRLRATVDQDGGVHLVGIFDPDVYLPGVLRDPPADPRRPRLMVPDEARLRVTTPCAKCVAASDARRSSG